MSIDCFGPPFKFGDFTDLDLKQNAFLRRWISPHQHRKNSANERNSNLFEGFTASASYFRTGKYIHFFTINAPLEYYFFFNMEIDYSKISQKCKAPE